VTGADPLNTNAGHGLNGPCHLLLAGESQMASMVPVICSSLENPR
jgi:hypothetical protein